jgi:hypothetical protein
VVHVTVTTGEGTSATSAADQFTCGAQAAAPTVTAIAPKQGPAAGGTAVTITGTDLTGATEVKFGAVAATNVTPVSATEVKATSPAGSGKVHVTVVTGGGASTASAADEFTYEAAPTRSLTITKAGSGSGSFTCNGVLCQSAYPVGTIVVLHGAADAGSTFVGWSGGGCAGAGDCTVILSANTSIVATFNPAAHDNPSTNPGTGSSSSSSPGQGSGASTPPPGNQHKTAAEMLKEKQQKALAKCKKLHGKAKTQCVKKAKQIGKPKPKPKAKKKK